MVETFPKLEEKNNMGNEVRRREKETEVPKKLQATSGFFSSKGYIYTLEALLVISLIVLSIAFMFSAPSQRPELEISNIKLQGFDALEYLDKTGELRRIVWENDEKELESQLSQLLSKNLAIESNICKTNCSAASVTVNETVVGVKYYVADYRNIYLGKKVILWMWRKL